MDLQPHLLATLQKISLFKDLSPTQLKQILRVCSQENYAPDACLCRAGTDSDCLYILLSGEVEICMGPDLVLGRESAVTTIGEAGMVTGEPRLASVIARTPVTALVLPRRPFQRLFQADPSLGVRLHRNVVLLLRQKLRAADARIGELLQPHPDAAQALPHV